MQQQKIAFIGAGNMSKSIISGLIAKHYPSKLIMAANPSQDKLDELQSSHSILITNDNNEAINWADIIVLAVKPQLMETMCQSLTIKNIDSKLFVTIAAGIPSNRYNDYFNTPIRLVRVMPNTPSLLGLGMSGMYAPEGINADDKALISQIMQSVGEILWVNEEQHIDSVIACSGSSPAYFFLMMEYMQQSAVKMGLTPQEARLLIQQAALGAAQMVKHNDHLELSELRKQVTSKGGTTHAAIETLKEQGLENCIDQAMNNAVSRASEMAKQF
jgi:pyrroline-5-carboxylate reductase